MAKLTPAQIAEVKGQGFLINRGSQLFSGRIVPAGGVFSAKQLKVISDVAEKLGNGKIVSTSRLAVEVTGIPYEIVPFILTAIAIPLYFPSAFHLHTPIYS